MRTSRRTSTLRNALPKKRKRRLGWHTKRSTEVYAEAYKEEYDEAFLDAYGAHREELLNLRAPQIEKTRERLAQIAQRGAAR
jgi:hypothetical protein